MPCLHSRAVRGELWGSHHLVSRSSTGLWSFMAQFPQVLLQGMEMSGKGRAGEHCENTVSALHCAHSCVEEPTAHTGNSNSKPCKAKFSWREAFLLSPLVQLSLLRKVMKLGMKGNRTRAQLLQEINSRVLSLAAARGHCELAAAGGEVFSSEAAHCQQSTLTCLMREVRIAYVLLRLLSSVSTQLPAGSAVCTSS